MKVQDAHDRRKCRDENGSEPWACGDCDCTARLDAKLKNTGKPFLELLQSSVTDRAPWCGENGEDMHPFMNHTPKSAA